MGKAKIVRRGGGAGEPTPPPSINFVSATGDSITFTLTNNSVSAREITYGLTTPPTDESFLLAGLTTSDPLTITGLDSETAYTIYSQAEDSVITEETFSTILDFIIATGGTIVEYNLDGKRYRSHSFNSVGASTFTVTQLASDTELNMLDYLIIAGGGGGGTRHGGGGGAGGYRTTTGATASGVATNPLFTVSPQSYNIVVGTGGNGGVRTGIRPSNQSGAGRNGTDSSAFGVTTTGGGGGGGATSSTGFAENAGRVGGSGGGADSTRSGSAGISGQGRNGGSGRSSVWSGGGGGGAGAVGSAASTSGVGGNGGAGLANLLRTGSNETRAAGGGGASAYGTQTYIAGSGGTGGGGNGGAGNNSGQNATQNTGSGGGGGGHEENGANGGNGANGIVIVRYEIAPN